MSKLGSRVLITGAAGFIGSHLAEKLRSMGLEVVGIDNFSNGYEENLAALKGDPGFRLIRGDILRVSGVTSRFIEEAFRGQAMSREPKRISLNLRH